MNWSTRLFFTFVLSLCFSQIASSQVTAEWSSLGQLRNDYDVQKFVGVTAISGFHVTSGSGYIDLLGSLSSGRTIANNTRDVRIWVEEGRDYEIALSVTFDSNQNASPSTATCFQVTYDAAAFPGPAVHDVKAFARSGPGHYCPTVALFVSGEADAFQLNASDGTFADHVRVTWNEIEGANTYRVFRCLDEDVSSCGALIGLSNDNGFDDIEGMDETTYWYRVKSCSASGCSDFSLADTGHRSESSGQPASPTGVNATDGSFTDRVRVSWNSTTGATRYDVFRCTNNMTDSCGSSFRSYGSIVKVDDRVNLGLAAETTFWYRVKACNKGGCSSFSEANSGFTKAGTANGDCDETYVQIDHESWVINVAPTGIGDTANIQCALDTAVSMGIPTVKLQSSTYYISKLMVEKFNGTLEGTSKTTTILEVVGRSIHCDAMDNSGLLPAAIKFVKGEPRLRFMTIRAYDPCAPGDLHAIVHYTGESAQIDNCNNDVIFGVTDRVIIEGPPGRSFVRMAIAVEPEGKRLGGCKDTLLGTYKLNRSTIIDTDGAIVTSMKSGAQVDINFNEFRGNITAVGLFDTNQNTTITANKFYRSNVKTLRYSGIEIFNHSDNPPPSTRLVVHNNEFNIPASIFRDEAIYVSTSSDVKVSSVITANKFNLSGKAYGLKFANTSNTHVSANQFNGSGQSAIYIYGQNPMSGWTITANKGLASFSSASGEDILFNSNTSNCIVGPGQGANVQDDGIDNKILPQWPLTD